MRIAAKSMYGATLSGKTAEFRVWAPNPRRLALRLLGRSDFPMQRDPDGTFHATVPAAAGDRYFYVVDDKAVPDPVSRLLPEGVYGPTEIVDPESFRWSDAAWRGRKLRDYFLYELHVGTFTPQGTFDGVIGKLDYLKRLGVTAIELMPVAAFPGQRNWGYDGVSPYAVQASYGGPEGLKRLVDAAHARGLTVLQDVVYNHLGPEGNYLRLFGPYFTDRHKTPWGDAINYDAPGSEGVRRYVVENALYWVREYHLDGLRLDAVQTIHDDSPLHILAKIQENVQELAREQGRRICVIAETDENDPRLVRPPADHGYGLDAVWSDDFHHGVHAALTGERQGYYQDFGRREQIARALNDGFVFQGEFFGFWGKARGAPPRGMTAPKHVICIQNHDQVGNRARGERLDALVPRGAHKMAAALMLLAPHTPLLFMGEEYGETAPFLYFTDHSDPALQKAVSEGRRKEFKDFRWEDVPDPQDERTFQRSRLTWALHAGRDMLDWYRKLLELRRQVVALGERTCRAEVRQDAIVMQVLAREQKLMVIAEFPDSGRISPGREWREVMRSEEDGYGAQVYVTWARRADWQ